MQATALAQRPLVAVRRTGESHFIGKGFANQQPQRRMFADLSEPRAGAQLQSHYRRDFNPDKVNTCMLHRVVILEDCPVEVLEESLSTHGTVRLEPDLIDLALRHPGISRFFDEVYAVLKSNPGPYVAKIHTENGRPFIGWMDFTAGIVPSGTAFLVYSEL